MSRILILLAILGVSTGSAAAHSRPGQCLLQVRGKTFLKGSCEVTINDDRGSFAIGVGESRRAKYFAYVNMEDDGAHGYWNETPDSNHADTDLGKLKRDGACWVNKTARVCAYQ
jgi:hypothetical protein